MTADAAAISAADSPEGSKSAREADVQAQPDAVPESGVSSAPANGSEHGAATSNDCDPFAETDAALHSTALPQVQFLQVQLSSLYDSVVHCPVWQQDCCEGMVHLRASRHLRQLLCAQREQEEPARTQDDGDGTLGGQKASGEAQQDLFGGLTLSAAADNDKSLI